MVSDTRTAAGLAAEGEFLDAARRAADIEGDAVMASAYALVAIAEILYDAVDPDSGLLGVANYPQPQVAHP